MKDYNKILSAIEKEQLAYVEKVRDILFDLLEAYGVVQRQFEYTNIGRILDSDPKFGHKFICNTNGTPFMFVVVIRDNFIEVTGFTAGSLPATKIVKKWYSLKKLEREFISVFGPCFNKNF